MSEQNKFVTQAYQIVDKYKHTAEISEQVDSELARLSSIILEHGQPRSGYDFVDNVKAVVRIAYLIGVKHAPRDADVVRELVKAWRKEAAASDFPAVSSTYSYCANALEAALAKRTAK